MSSLSLDQYLDALEREDDYRVESVLKSSDFETTEVVYLSRAGSPEEGPYIRKTFARDLGLGLAYERIFAVQNSEPHPSLRHIPTVYECYRREEALVAVMEYIDGETLQDYVYRCDPSPALAAQIFPSLCDAVSELHESFDPPLIHRDLKPSNVMVAGGQAVIIDFGIAREFKDTADGDTVHFGTRAYAPPEQFGYGQTTVRSDIYALGMLLYFCLVEETPNAQVVEAKFADRRIPAPLQRVLAKATAFDPQNRYASARDLKAAFVAALSSHDAVPATSPGANASTDSDVKRDSATSPVVQFAPSPATPSEPPYETAPKKALSPVGIVYDIVIALATALVLGTSFSLVFNPPARLEGYPSWFGMLGYAFFVPVITIATALLIAYKQPLVNRFPRIFGRLKRWHYIVGYLIVWFAMIVFLGIVTGFVQQ